MRLRLRYPPAVALRERLPAAAPVPKRTLAAVVAAFALLAALVAAGPMTPVDQFSLDHLMPWLVPGNASAGNSAGFWRPFALHTSTGTKILNLWVYPCSVLVSGLAVAGCAALSWRRLGPVAALGPAAAWLVGNAIEVLGKGTIVRPALYGHADGLRVHAVAYDDSFPSGHMMRGLIVAYAVVMVWRRARPYAIVWVVLVGPALVLNSAHTLTDVVGGALLGIALLIPVNAVVVAAQPEHAPG